MANYLASCVKKGVVLGRVGQALSELHMGIDFEYIDDIGKIRLAVDELKNTIRPLKKNLRSSAEEVRLMEAGVKKMSKLLQVPDILSHEALAFAKVELKEIRTQFRKAVRTGFSDCGAPKIEAYETADLLNDNAYYIDTHPEFLTDISK
jgi:hypothetical protein